MLVHKSMPEVAALYNAILRSEGGRKRWPEKILLFDSACGLAHRVTVTKLAELDGDICPYLATLMVAALACTSEASVMPEGMQIPMIIREAFENVLLKQAGCNYNNYKLITRQVLGFGVKGCMKRLNGSIISILRPS